MAVCGDSGGAATSVIKAVVVAVALGVLVMAMLAEAVVLVAVWEEMAVQRR